MKKLLLLCLLFLYSTFLGFSAYKIHIKAPQLVNDSIFLAGYYNGKIYALDTLALNNKGEGVFTGNKTLDEGLYMLYLSPQRHYDFLVGKKQDLVAKIDTNKLTLQMHGDIQTEAFIDFGTYMMQKKEEQSTLKKKQDEAKGDSIKEKAILLEIKKLDDDVIDYQKSIAERFKGELMDLFLKALIIPQFPEELLHSNLAEEELQMAKYQYAKYHYWDNIDLSDIRSWRLNMLNRKLQEYLQHIIIPNPDSITEAAIYLIEKSKQKNIPYKYDKNKPTSYELLVNYMIQYSVTSKMMGMDNLMVALADKYYFTGEAPWADSTIMANIATEVKKVRHNLIGMTAANLPLKKYDGNTFNIHDIKSKCTLLYFYEPSCGHCKEVTPKLYNQVYQKYKSKGLEIIAMYIMTDKKEWKDFLDKHQLFDWINAWDPNRQSFYWQFFDTSTTPGIYLLDKDKKIIAKKIDIPSVEKILEIELNK